VEKGLCEETPIEPLDSTEAVHLEVLVGYSAEDLHLNLKYYADEDQRREWANSGPRILCRPMRTCRTIAIDTSRSRTTLSEHRGKSARYLRRMAAILMRRKRAW